MLSSTCLLITYSLQIISRVTVVNEGVNGATPPPLHKQFIFLAGTRPACDLQSLSSSFCLFPVILIYERRNMSFVNIHTSSNQSLSRVVCMMTSAMILGILSAAKLFLETLFKSKSYTQKEIKIKK